MPTHASSQKHDSPGAVQLLSCAGQQLGLRSAQLFCGDASWHMPSMQTLPSPQLSQPVDGGTRHVPSRHSDDGHSTASEDIGIGLPVCVLMYGAVFGVLHVSVSTSSPSNFGNIVPSIIGGTHEPSTQVMPVGHVFAMHAAVRPMR